MHISVLCLSRVSLFQAVTGGIDWKDLANPLSRAIHPLLGFTVVLYVAFSVLAMLNVVTGVFVDNVLYCAKEAKDDHMLNLLRGVLKRIDFDESGSIEWDEFQEHLDTPELQAMFASIHVDVSEARGLFRLLDVKQTNRIDVEEFLAGCMSLRGSAKALNLEILMHETYRLSKGQRLLQHEIKAFRSVCSSSIASMQKLIPPLMELQKKANGSAKQSHSSANALKENGTPMQSVSKLPQVRGVRFSRMSALSVSSTTSSDSSESLWTNEIVETSPPNSPNSAWAYGEC